MKKRSLTVGALGLVALLILGTTNVLARGNCGGGFGGFMGGRVMRMADRLDLNKSQRDQIWQILDSVRGRAREAMEIVHENRKGLRSLARSDAYDLAKAERFAQAQAGAMADLMVIKSQTHAKIRAVMTPEQKAMFDTMRARRGKGGPHRLGRLKGRGLASPQKSRV